MIESSSRSRRSTGSVADRRRRIAEVVLRQVAEQSAGEVERGGLVGRGKVGDAAASRVRRRPAEALCIDVLVGHGSDDVRPGDEHEARPVDHDREVRDRRRIDRSAGARAEDDRDLRDDARGERVAKEDVGIATERGDAFLDPGAARIVEPDHRRPDLHRQVHDLADLGRVRLRQRAAEDGEVLAEDEDEPAIDRAVSGDDAVAEDRSPVRRRPQPFGRLVTNASSSTNESASRRRSRRSRAVSRPAACWRAIRSSPPPSRDSARIRSSRSIRSLLDATVTDLTTCACGRRRSGVFVHRQSARPTSVHHRARPRHDAHPRRQRDFPQIR